MLCVRHVVVWRHPVPQPAPRHARWPTCWRVRREPLVNDRLHRAAANQQLRCGTPALWAALVCDPPERVCAPDALDTPARRSVKSTRGGWDLSKTTSLARSSASGSTEARRRTARWWRRSLRSTRTTARGRRCSSSPKVRSVDPPPHPPPPLLPRSLVASRVGAGLNAVLHRNVCEQPLRYAVQEGRLRTRRAGASDCHQVQQRPSALCVWVRACTRVRADPPSPHRVVMRRRFLSMLTGTPASSRSKCTCSSMSRERLADGLPRARAWNHSPTLTWRAHPVVVGRLMTSWAVVCDVWYLETQTRQPGESPSDFAKRVKVRRPSRQRWCRCAAASDTRSWSQ